MEVETADESLKVECKLKKGKSIVKIKDKSGEVTKEMVEALAAELEAASNLTGKMRAIHINIL